jgi:hypothetical protein
MYYGLILPAPLEVEAHIFIIYLCADEQLTQFVEAMRYKPEGCGFPSVHLVGFYSMLYKHLADYQQLHSDVQFGIQDTSGYCRISFIFNHRHV